MKIIQNEDGAKKIIQKTKVFNDIFTFVYAGISLAVIIEKSFNILNLTIQPLGYIALSIAISIGLIRFFRARARNILYPFLKANEFIEILFCFFSFLGIAILINASPFTLVFNALLGTITSILIIQFVQESEKK